MEIIVETTSKDLPWKLHLENHLFIFILIFLMTLSHLPTPHHLQSKHAHPYALHTHHFVHKFLYYLLLKNSFKGQTIVTYLARMRKTYWLLLAWKFEMSNSATPFLAMCVIFPLLFIDEMVSTVLSMESTTHPIPVGTMLAIPSTVQHHAPSRSVTASRTMKLKAQILPWVARIQLLLSRSCCWGVKEWGHTGLPVNALSNNVLTFPEVKMGNIQVGEATNI